MIGKKARCISTETQKTSSDLVDSIVTGAKGESGNIGVQSARFLTFGVSLERQRTYFVSFEPKQEEMIGSVSKVALRPK